ncbi:hypothetical protein M8J75_006590 [Diaphorina citri]|nr:hypothetical protein M8J75_006590 [Diaphorina citri]
MADKIHISSPYQHQAKAAATTCDKSPPSSGLDIVESHVNVLPRDCTEIQSNNTFIRNVVICHRPCTNVSCHTNNINNIIHDKQH